LAQTARRAGWLGGLTHGWAKSTNFFAQKIKKTRKNTYITKEKKYKTKDLSTNTLEKQYKLHVCFFLLKANLLLYFFLFVTKYVFFFVSFFFEQDILTNSTKVLLLRICKHT
jgi:hypothetical protein